jgi:cytochrome c oxidase assembly protein subunit 15
MTNVVSERRFRLFCWAVLAFVIFVIVWGAFVRASGSGAGCGSHWPTCNGEVIPSTPGKKTLIEVFHRWTSGLSALLVLAQIIWSRRLFATGHRVRKAAALSGLFMLGEVAIGAALVLLHLVGDNDSISRAVIMGVHLLNTFLLVGAMTLTAHFAGGGPGFRVRGHGTLSWLAIGSVVGIMFVGASGGVAALGDTLFPAESLGTALAQDLSTTAHVLVRLRIVHPFVAVGVAMLVLFTRVAFHSKRGDNPGVGQWGLLLRVLVVGQMMLGLVNTMLLAPIWMQLAHLFVADALFIALTMLIAVGFCRRSQEDIGDDVGVAQTIRST